MLIQTVKRYGCDVGFGWGLGVAGAIRSQWLNVPRLDQEIYSAIGLAIATVIGLTIDLIGDLMYLFENEINTW